MVTLQGNEDISRRQIPELGGIFPGAGAGGGLNVDFSGGAGAGLGGLLGGGIPGWGGWAGPYVPVTPLGALGGIKGDLIVPIVAVGVALFLLVLIVLAVKAALAWKLSVLEDLAGPRRFSREAGSAAAPHLEDGVLDQLAKIVTTAIYSGSCSDRMICEAGAFARGNAQTINGIIALVDSYVPSSYHSYLDILKSSAEGSFDCAQKYQCGQQNQNQQQQGQPGNLNKLNAAFSAANPQQQQQQAFNGQQSTPRPQLNEVFLNGTTTPRPLQQKFGKFRRGV